jgi:hypothetical protein
LSSQRAEIIKKSLDIVPLKKWVRKNIPLNSSLRELILLEGDKLTPEGFLSKMETWLTLLDIESKKSDK